MCWLQVAGFSSFLDDESRPAKPLRGLSELWSVPVAWPSGLRRWFKAPVSSEAWVRIPPLPHGDFDRYVAAEATTSPNECACLKWILLHKRGREGLLRKGLAGWFYKCISLGLGFD